MASISRLRRRLLLSGAGLLASRQALSSEGAAADFPGGQPIRIVVPTTPGGSADIIARLLSVHVGNRLKVPVIVENVNGAGGTVGAARVARAQPDGRTLLLGFTSNIGTAPILMRDLPYDPVRDFAPVGRAVSVSLCVVCHADLPVRDMKELVELARARAGDTPLMYGAWGNGSAAHLTMESINFHARAGMKMVPYKSEADVQRALLGKEVPVAPQTIGLLLPHVRSGRFKVLGIASRQRSALLPEVPTLAQQGIPFDLSAWLGVFAPAGTPVPVLDQLASAMAFALKQPDVVARTQAIGMDIESVSRQAFTASIPAEIATWRQLIQAANVQVQ